MQSDSSESNNNENLGDFLNGATAGGVVAGSDDSSQQNTDDDAIEDALNEATGTSISSSSNEDDSSSVASNSSLANSSVEDDSADSESNNHSASSENDSASSSDSEASSSSSDTASSAGMLASTSTTDNSSLSSAHEEAFQPDVDDDYDAVPNTHIDISVTKLNKYIECAKKDFRRKPDEATFDSHLELLKDAQMQMAKGIKELLSEYSHTVNVLTKQTHVVDQECQELADTSPRAEAGLTAKLIQQFHVIAWIFKEPRFKTFVREYSEKHPLRPSHIFMTKADEAKQKLQTMTKNTNDNNKGGNK